MAGFIDEFRKAGARFEKPFLVTQVETHLIFGPISRYVSFGYVAIFAGIVAVAAGFFAQHKPAIEYVGDTFDALLFLTVPILVLLWTRRQQAILGWIAAKAAVGVAAFMMATIGAGMSFMRGDADAWAFAFLGLIWIPGVEFIPKVTPNQRYVTITRIVLSIPCVYFGIKSGNWTW